MKKLTILILFLLILPLTSAFEIYSEPSQINFENVLINSLVEKKIKISTDSPEDIEVSLSPSGILANWVTIEPANQKINQNNPAEFKIKINPVQAQLGTYQGLIIVNAIYTGNQLTSTVTSATNLDITLTLTDIEIIQARLSNIIVKDIEINQPIQIQLFLQNDGNKAISPNFELILQDQQQNTIKTISQNMEIIPSVDPKEIDLTFDNDLLVGNYQILSKITYNNYLISQQTAPFKIVEPGTLPQEPKLIVEVQEAIPLSSTPTMIVGVLILAIIVYYGIRKKRDYDQQKRKRKK